MSTHTSGASIFETAKQILGFAQQGAVDFEAKGDRAHLGLYSAITHGRSVTFVLQNLKSFERDFDDWYAPHQDRMRRDEKAKYFVELRNRIEKQGQPGRMTTSIVINSLTPTDLAAMARLGPAGAVRMFVGDQWGRSGWDVRLPDGTETTVFYSLPVGFTEAFTSVDDAPDGFTFEADLRPWLDSIAALLAAAEERFPQKAS